MSDIDESEDVRDRGMRHTGGASISSLDPRVSRGIGFGLGVLGLALVGAAGWIATSINSLNITMARVLVQNEAFFRQLERHESEINALQRDVSVLEERTSEARHGR